MKTSLRFVVVALSLLSLNTFAQQQTEYIDLYITDHDNHLPIADASVSVGRLHQHTNRDGFVSIPRKSLTADSLYITCLGYDRHAVAVKDLHGTQMRIALCHTATHLGTAVVAADRQRLNRTIVADKLDKRIIEQNLGNSMGATLRSIKGVSTIESGANIAKPVIHGMYGNRILIVNNGARQQGQQWGDDHAPEVDLNAAATVNVVKGAQAVRYGSDALGGIVLLDAAPLPYASDKAIGGQVSALYASNGHRFASTAEVEGTIPRWKGFAWRAQGTWLNGGDRSAANYLLNNTAARELSFSLAAGYRTERWGMEAYFSRYFTKAGVMYSAHPANEALLKERIAYGQPLEFYPFSRHIDYPYHKVAHHLLRLKGFYNLTDKDVLTAQVSLQTDNRNEYHLRRNDLSNIPSLSLDLSAFQADLIWKRLAQRWNTEAGLFFGGNKNTNLAGTGIVPIIPNYTQILAGAYAVQRYTTQRWGAEIGVRADWQESKAKGINALGQRYGGTHHFTNFIYNAGANYRITPQLELTSNIGIAWRAPHVYELYSNGLDHASGVYVQGDSTMRSERSTKWITTLAYKTERFSVSVDGFLQWVSNYLYDEPTGAYMTVISGAYPVFRYKQVPAFFRGIDGELSYEPINGLRYNAMASMVWVNERSTNRYLPYIPPFRLTQSISYTLPQFKGLKGSFIKATHRFVAKQTRFDAATDLVDHAPEAYNLFGLEMGTTLHLHRTGTLTILLQAENLFNKEYKEYTNRYRYYAHDLGRDLRLMLTYKF